MHSEDQYLDLLHECLVHGDYREGRNGGTYGVFGRQIRYDLSKGFPLLTTKRIYTKGVIAELLWFIAGETNAKILEDQGVNIWAQWGDPVTRELGPVYGKQWRAWETNKDQRFVPTIKAPNGEWADGYLETRKIDQLAQVINDLKKDPFSRRHIVSAWNVTDLPDMALAPCHCLFQFFVSRGRLSCQLYQRSADIFLGVPFNIASYALLTHLVAREVDLEVGEFVHTFGDLHLYENHVEQAREQLSRVPLPMPRLVINPGAGDIFNLKISDFSFEGYDPHPAIKAPVSA